MTFLVLSVLALKCIEKKDGFSNSHGLNTSCKNGQIALSTSYLYSDRTLTLTLTANLTVTINT